MARAISVPEQLEVAARQRIRLAEGQIRNSLRRVAEGNPLAAEWQSERLVSRLQTKALLSREEAETVARGIRARVAPDAAKKREAADVIGPERIYGSTIDFVGVAFLNRATKAARAVARVAFRDGRGLASGFMVSEQLFLTNNHVIASADAAEGLCVEFDYELDPADRPRGTSRFVLDPAAFFLTDGTDDLDYTLIAVGPRLSGPRELSTFGWCPMSDRPDKHALGEVANIVQHPDGRYKELVLRENRLVSRLDSVLHYVADTEPGSSGSPVFNNEWHVIGLHHWGGPWRQTTDRKGQPVPREVNEAIRTSAVVAELGQRRGDLAPAQRKILDDALAIGEGQLQPMDSDGQPAASDTAPRVSADGAFTWRIPIEITARLPLAAPGAAVPPASVSSSTSAAPAFEAKLKPSTEYSDRSGYKPRFITGLDIALPRLSAEQRKIAAKNRQAEPGDDPFELKYHHFSIVMNRRRRLAFFTTTNIDGRRAKKVDRKTGTVSVLEPDDPGLEALLYETDGPEASESWYVDKRLDLADFAGKDVYEQQVVPGYLDTRSMARTYRMFQRGHLVRRMDPAWGSDQQALKADADTFHWTNCTPQVGFFNMGTAAKLGIPVPNTGGGRLWRAIENYVLRNAVVEDKRVSVFTGPIFQNNDRTFRSIRVPGRFWKIVLWSEHGEPRSLAMLADQRPVITVWPEKKGELAEAFADPDELSRVRDFLSTVAEIEDLTGLTFDDTLRDADIHHGEAAHEVGSFDEIALAPERRRKTKPARPRKRRK